jgi:hypothetical protein
MIMSSFLTFVFFIMALYCIVSVKSPVFRCALICGYLIAIFFVWNQDKTTVIANFLGIGRGLDFALVLLCIAIMNVLLFVISHLSMQHRMLTKLARHIALDNSSEPSSK